ncbi:MULTISPECIES: ATP-dependent Clp protease proteolytic subunit [Tenebrionibacter/Tenebrionicola group]|jgi:ATP-dependent Clp protease protease subunit|uniref:ATP-dependent Clp protease proteolytic subunit n=2 Tax=Tenebrionibacter/Tenebrionicola group TaxID=2969848 RepID=A0A8K0XY00_9ENTR|nr:MULTISPECIES: ATP-dependent Clp protease proteolytic subunit [Tenebrionibacter/Tenebrionicola group]MBK4716881.1 ATP-dependent Clp protease proteolytic subunit [Tenebrionibacter intestinalis]MBV4413228.1 ATP-dependent Clp protease proteolytic subunit [Tenebrionicola larvae]MBV5097002.1 ATP-dependent Clp protease proteolytic subunit [Tenebrionicola larvae]
MSEEQKQEKQEQEKSPTVDKALLKSRTVIISEKITQELAAKVTARLLALQEMSDEPITLFINSQGGHVEAGDTIHDMIKFIRPEVRVVGTGWVASAGITIYLAARKENRYTLPNTRFMIHQPLGGVRGQVTDIQIEANEILRIRDRINRIISDGTGQPYEKVVQDTDRNFWMSPQEAIEYGIATHLITHQDELGKR